jgi:hypothetical protein
MPRRSTNKRLRRRGVNPRLRAYKKAQDQGDYDKAHHELRRALAADPLVIRDSLVTKVLKRLVTDNIERQHPLDERLGLAAELVSTFAAGLGVKVKIDHRSRHLRGPRIGLFPSLKERQGWCETDAARRDSEAAHIILAYVEVLSHRFSKLDYWKTIRREFHEHRKEADIDMIAEDVQEIVEQLKNQEGLVGQTLSQAHCRSLVKQALEAKSPRKALVYLVIGTLPLPCLEHVEPAIAATLIQSLENDLKTLYGRKHVQSFLKKIRLRLHLH